MTPSLPDILIGHAAALSAPQPPESSGDYLAGRLGLLAMLSLLAAQEASQGVAVRIWENGAIREVLASAAPRYDAAFEGALGQAASVTDEDRRWAALDERNDSLRRLLIGLHEAVEARKDAALDRKILTLYQAMAKARRLELPAALGG